MRQLPSDKYNVAWFKLAEFVSRGERERALGLYKLLVHSFDDHALALQLEGDIILSFNDSKEACQKYRQAAHCYKQDKRYAEAAAVYEHILVLDHDAHEDRITLIAIYEILAVMPRLLLHLDHLCCMYICAERFDHLNTMIQEWSKKLDHFHATTLYKNITVNLIKNSSSPEIVRAYLKRAIEYFMLGEDDLKSSLQTFLSTIEALHKDYYCEAKLQLQEL